MGIAHELSTAVQASDLTVAITATFTAEPLEDSLAFWAEELGLPLRCAFAPYNQVFQQLLGPTGLLAQNRNGLNAVLVRLEDWERPDERATMGRPLGPGGMARIEGDVRELARGVRALGERSSVPLLLCLCPPSVAATADSARAAFFGRMERLLASELGGLQGVGLVIPADVEAAYPVSAYSDAHADALGHVPYTLAFFAALGTFLARRIHALVTPARKVIVLDCDQTLWTGVCGEDGPLGVAIDPPRRALQEFLAARRQAGMLLCLCSKNNEDDVLAVFDRHPDMLLRLEHLAARRVNWQAKSLNLHALAADLRLGLDSFIFLDDDPLECADVQANCPEVLALRLPAPADLSRFLAHVWAFDGAGATAEDRARTALYEAEAQRRGFRARAVTLEEFLEGLRLEVRIAPMAREHLSRVAQLTQRTNQFNCTTIRRREAEIQRSCREGAECLAVHVTDRFGDYGLVGVLLFRAAAERLAVDTFLLSCRAMGRGVEHRMLAALGEIARSRGCAAVEILFRPTAKNGPARDFLQSLGVPPHQGEGGCLRFGLPSGAAAAARYRPPAARPAAEGTGAAGNTGPRAPGIAPAPVPPPGHATALRIATELNDAQRIVAAIQARRRRSRTPGIAEAAVAELLALVEGLSDARVEAMLAERQRAPRPARPRDSHRPPAAAAAPAVRPGRPAGGGADGGERYQCADIETIPLGNGYALVYTGGGRIAHLLPAATADLLSRCRGFKTLERHARGLGGETGDGPRAANPAADREVEAVTRRLADLAEAGFLMSRRGLLEQCRQSAGAGGAAGTPGPPIACVGIVTRDRPEAMERGLASYIQNSKHHGKTNDFVVVDDSRSSEMRRAYQGRLRTLKARYGVRISYAGREEKMRFAKSLIRRGGFPPDVVHSALFDVHGVGLTSGMNATALHLHAVGDPVFKADDDTVCRLAPNPAATEGVAEADGPHLALCAGRDPSEYWVFRNREAALRSAQFAEEDLLGLHEKLLGRPVGAIVAEAGPQEAIALDGLERPFLRRLEAEGGTVAVTFNGLLGDCGWGAPFGFWAAPMGYLLLEGRSHERLVQSEADYRAACTSRDILRVVPRTSISDHSFGMGTFLGIDYRGTMPPFFPVGRGSDLVFTECVWRCRPDGLFGHLPWALLHDPVEHRRFSPGEIFRTASGFDTAKLLLACIGSCPWGPGRADAADRLRALGGHLEALGALPLPEFEAFVRVRVGERARGHIALAEERLRQCGEAPAFWAKDLRKYLDLLCRSLARDDYLVPLDLVDRRGMDEAPRLAQRLVGDFGRLLTLWPDIIDVAKDLRRRGRRLGTPI